MFTRGFARTTVIAGAALLAASLSACSDDSSDADASTSATTTSAAPSSTTAASAASSASSSSVGDHGDPGGSDGIAVGEPTPGGGGSGGSGGDGNRSGGGGGDDGGGGPVDDRCSVEALQQAFGGEVTQVGSVAYCDGDWAVSGNSPAYLNQPFMHREHGWVVFAADSSNPGALLDVLHRGLPRPARDAGCGPGTADDLHGHRPGTIRDDDRHPGAVTPGGDAREGQLTMVRT